MHELTKSLFDKFKSIGIDKRYEVDNRLLYFIVDGYENQRILDYNGNYYMVGSCVEKGKLESIPEIDKIFEAMEKSLNEDILKYEDLEISNLSISLFESEDTECLIISSDKSINKGSYKYAFTTKKMPASFIDNAGFSIYTEKEEVFFKIELLIKGQHEFFNPNNLVFSSSEVVVNTEKNGEMELDEIKLYLQSSLNNQFAAQKSGNNLSKNFTLYEFLKLNQKSLYRKGNIRIFLENNEIMIEALYEENKGKFLNMFN